MQATADLRRVVEIGGGSFSSFATVQDLKIDFIRQLGSDLPELRFLTFVGEHYVVESSADLAAQSWTTISGGDVTGDGIETAVVDSSPATVSARFYRVRIGQ